MATALAMQLLAAAKDVPARNPTKENVAATVLKVEYAFASKANVSASIALARKRRKAVLARNWRAKRNVHVNAPKQLIASAKETLAAAKDVLARHPKRTVLARKTAATVPQVKFAPAKATNAFVKAVPVKVAHQRKKQKVAAARNNAWIHYIFYYILYYILHLKKQMLVYFYLLFLFFLYKHSNVLGNY